MMSWTKLLTTLRNLDFNLLPYLVMDLDLVD